MKKSNSLTMNLAFKNLSRQKKRSFLLAGAIAFGFFVVTVIEGLASGAVKNLENQITDLIGGSVIIQGVEYLPGTEEGKKGPEIAIIRDTNFVQDVVAKSGINYSYYTTRVANTGTLLYEGKQVTSQIYGCDFAHEDYLMKSIVLKEGNLDDISKKDCIILNEKIANSLKINVGEQLIYSTSTNSGQNTFGEFTVIAITKDASFLSSIACYVRQDTLNELILAPEGSYSMFCISIPNKNNQAKYANILENLMRNEGKTVGYRLQAVASNPTSPITAINRQIKDTEFEGTMYVSLCMNDAMPQIQQVMTVVHAVTTIILIVILLIVMVGISNTYKMVLYERIKEIGTERALGMTGKETGKVFTTEALILSIIGAVAGFILAVFAMWIFGLIHFNSITMSLFLFKGHATCSLSFGSIVLKFIIMIFLTIFAVHGTAKNASKLSPAIALRTVK